MQNLPGEKLYTVSEAARQLGLHPETLRRWEKAGKIKSRRSLGGQRLFSQNDIQEIRNLFNSSLPQVSIEKPKENIKLPDQNQANKRVGWVQPLIYTLLFVVFLGYLLQLPKTSYFQNMAEKEKHTSTSERGKRVLGIETVVVPLVEEGGVIADEVESFFSKIKFPAISFPAVISLLTPQPTNDITAETLGITGKAKFGNDVHILGNVKIEGEAEIGKIKTGIVDPYLIENDGIVQPTLEITSVGDISLEPQGSIIFKGPVSGITTLNLTSDASVGGNLTVTGSLTAGSLTTAGGINGLTSSALVFSGQNPSIYPSTTNSEISLNANGTGAIDIGNTSTGDIYLGGGSDHTGCTLTNSDGSFNCSGDLTTGGRFFVNGGTIASSATTFNLLNTNVTSVNLGGAATSLSIGASTGTTVINNALDVTGATTLSSNLAVNGGSITTTATTGNLFNTNATTLNLGGAATTLSIGAATGTTTVNNALTNTGAFTANGGITDTGNFSQTGTGTFSTGTGAISLNGNTSVTGTKTFTVGTGATSLGGTLGVTGDTTLTGNLAVNGGSITTTATTGNLFNTNATTLNIGGAGTTLSIGAATGTTTVNNALAVTGATTLTGNLAENGGTISTTATTGNLFNTNATTLNIGGAGTTLSIGAATGTTTVNNALSVTGNLTVSGVTTTNGNVTLGSGVSNTVTFNGVVNSNIVPSSTNAYTLGSASKVWSTGYFTTVSATNLSGTVTGGNTTSATWTINSGNATNNAQISDLAFSVGTAPINDVLQWNASGDTTNKITGFDNTNLFNYPIGIFSQVSGLNQTFTSGTLFKYSQPSTHAITQSGAFIGSNVDFSSNITVPNSASGNQTGYIANLKDGGASATSIGFQTAGTLDYGLDIGGTIGSADIRLSNAATIDNITSGTLQLTATSLTLNGNTTVSANKNLTLASGTGVFSETSTNTSSDAFTLTDTSMATNNQNLANLSFTNNNTGAGITVNGLKLTANAPGIPSSGTQTTNIINLSSPALTQTTAVTSNINAMNLASPGALVQNTAAGTINWTYANITTPAITQTTGTVGVTGLSLTLGTITTGGTQTGINIAGGGGATGTTNGITFASTSLTNGINFSSDPATNYINAAHFTVTAAGAGTFSSTLTASNGFTVTTGAVNITSTSGNIDLSGSTGTFKTSTGANTLSGSTTVAANQNLTLASGTGQFAQTYTGTTTNGASITANSLTTGNALNLAFTQNAALNAGSSASGLNIAEAAATNSGNTSNLINLSAAAGGTVNGVNISSATGFTNFFKTPTFVLDSSGNVSGVPTLTATNLGGTITTASQTNITAVGTLTSLAVTGNVNSASGALQTNGVTRVDNSGNLTAGTGSFGGAVTPSLDATYDFGSAVKRWNNAYFAGDVTAGDVVFKNKFRMTENGNGIDFLNPKGEKVASIDENGNFWVKGEIKHGL